MEERNRGGRREAANAHDIAAVDLVRGVCDQLGHMLTGEWHCNPDQLDSLAVMLTGASRSARMADAEDDLGTGHVFEEIEHASALLAEAADEILGGSAWVHVDMALHRAGCHIARAQLAARPIDWAT